MKAKKMCWFGHVKGSDLPIRTTIEGMIEGKCHRRGRPRRRWIADIRDWCDISWAVIDQVA